MWIAAIAEAGRCDVKKRLALSAGRSSCIASRYHGRRPRAAQEKGCRVGRTEIWLRNPLPYGNEPDALIRL